MEMKGHGKHMRSRLAGRQAVEWPLPINFLTVCSKFLLIDKQIRSTINAPPTHLNERPISLSTNHLCSLSEPPPPPLSLSHCPLTHV